MKKQQAEIRLVIAGAKASRIYVLHRDHSAILHDFPDHSDDLEMRQTVINLLHKHRRQGSLIHFDISSIRRVVFDGSEQMIDGEVRVFVYCDFTLSPGQKVFCKHLPIPRETQMDKLKKQYMLFIKAIEEIAEQQAAA